MADNRHRRVYGNKRHRYGKRRNLNPDNPDECYSAHPGNSNARDDSGERPSNSGEANRDRHPSGLRGRAIGMFYARRSKARMREADVANRTEVTISARHAKVLRDLVRSEAMDENNESALSVAGPVTCASWYRGALVRDRALDEKLLAEHYELSLPTNKDYKRMQWFRAQLPTFSRREEIVRTIEANRVTVITGETGCGKTTQVPQFILDHYISEGKGSLCRLVCTQPRRISAITVADRVAAERGQVCGQPSSSSGYQIRLEAKLPRTSGSILYCTTGIVLKWLETDADLQHISHLILDEVHERDLLCDFLMIVLKTILANNAHIKLVLMSATLNADQFSRYYDRAPMLQIPGFTYPVNEYYLEDVVEWLNYRPARGKSVKPGRKRSKNERRSKEDVRNEQDDFDAFLRVIHGKYSGSTIDSLRRMDMEEVDVDIITQLIKYICCEKDPGAVLVFLPGWEQISNVFKKLTALTMFKSNRFLILPLHSMMPTVNQREVFMRPPSGVRKIVLATNIAETSITIDDVVFVIDCGKVKISNYDPELNLVTLQPEWNSLANSRQRRGRAGRVQAGECYHLYTSYQENKLELYQKPEILRTRLEELCLQIKLLKLGRIKDFVMKAMNTPEEAILDQSLSLLRQINALSDDEKLTPLGQHLARLPVDPQAGKMMLLGAMFSCLNPILTIAASLSFKDAFVIPLGLERAADARKRALSDGSKSDHILLVKAFDGWERARRQRCDTQYCWDNFLAASTLQMLADMKRQFADLLHNIGFIQSSDTNHPGSNVNSRNEKLIKAIVCAGLYPNVAKIWSKTTKRGQICSLRTKDGTKAKFHPKSVNATEQDIGSQWCVYHLKMKTNGVNIFDSTPISPFPLLFFGGDVAVRQEDCQNSIVVDDWIIFKAEPEIAHLVRDLRRQLDSVLRRKIESPGVVNWDSGSQECRLMKAIQELITKDVN